MTFVSALNVRCSSRVHQEPDGPIGIRAISSPELCLTFAGEAQIWGCAQASLFFLSSKQAMKWQPLSWGGNTVPTPHLVWQLRPAVHQPSSRKSKLTLPKQEPVPWAQSQACSHTYREEAQRVTNSAFKTTLDPCFHQHHCSSIEVGRLPCRQNCKVSLGTPCFTAHRRWASLVILRAKNESSLTTFSSFLSPSHI